MFISAGDNENKREKSQFHVAQRCKQQVGRKLPSGQRQLHNDRTKEVFSTYPVRFTFLMLYGIRVKDSDKEEEMDIDVEN